MNDQMTIHEDSGLINISKDSKGNETVNARDLWAFLRSKQQFSDWIKNRIQDYGFEKDKDYIVIHKNMKNPNGGRPIFEYYISIDMTKELAMVERNLSGKQIRKWFIERENKLKNIEMSVCNPPLLPDFNDPVAAARAWADAKESELKAKLELNEAQPKIEFHDQVGDSKGLYTIGQTAKLLGTGRNRLFKWLRDNNIFFKVEPYQNYIERGYFEVKTNSVNDHVQKQSFVTPKGLQWLQKRFSV